MRMYFMDLIPYLWSQRKSGLAFVIILAAAIAFIFCCSSSSLSNQSQLVLSHSVRLPPPFRTCMCGFTDICWSSWLCWFIDSLPSHRKTNFTSCITFNRSFVISFPRLKLTSFYSVMESCMVFSSFLTYPRFHSFSWPLYSLYGTTNFDQWKCEEFLPVSHHSSMNHSFRCCINALYYFIVVNILPCTPINTFVCILLTISSMTFIASYMEFLKLGHTSLRFLQFVP